MKIISTSTLTHFTYRVNKNPAQNGAYNRGLTYGTWVIAIAALLDLLIRFWPFIV